MLLYLLVSATIFTRLNVVTCKQNQKCPYGKYGDDCLLNCSANCEVSHPRTNSIDTCDTITGHCLDACKSGFHGRKCNKKCADHCVTCVKQTGRCIRCDKGYVENGTLCMDEKEQCPGNCLMDICDKDSVSCVRGCKAGFHGVRCNLTCHDACTEIKCAQDSGSCIHGCIHGYEETNSGCKVEEEQCPGNCLMDKCDKDSVSCVRGCKAGFHGVRCNLTCHDACTDIKCAQDSGSCIHGCINGYEETNNGCKVPEAGHGSSEENYVPYYAVSAMVLVVLVLSAYVIRRLKRMNILVYGNAKSRRPEPEPCTVAENVSHTEVTHSYYELKEGEMNIDNQRPLSDSSLVQNEVSNLNPYPDLGPNPIAGISRRPLPAVPKPLSNPYDEPDQNPNSEGGAEGWSPSVSIPVANVEKNLSKIYYSQYLTCVHESVSCGKCPALSHNATGPFAQCEGNCLKTKFQTL